MELLETMKVSKLNMVQAEMPRQVLPNLHKEIYQRFKQ